MRVLYTVTGKHISWLRVPRGFGACAREQREPGTEIREASGSAPAPALGGHDKLLCALACSVNIRSVTSAVRACCTLRFAFWIV